MKKTTGKSTEADVIGKALAARAPRRPQRMAREPAALAERDALPPAEPSAPAQVERPAAPPRTESKIARVVALLKRKQGATIAELIEATGWLPHTTRAALTGLRKKGHVVVRDKRGEVTCYRITEVA